LRLSNGGSMAHQAPDRILRLSMIETAKLLRQWNG